MADQQSVMDWDSVKRNSVWSGVAIAEFAKASASLGSGRVLSVEFVFAPGEFTVCTRPSNL